MRRHLAVSTCPDLLCQSEHVVTRQRDANASEPSISTNANKSLKY